MCCTGEGKVKYSQLYGAKECPVLEKEMCQGNSLSNVAEIPSEFEDCFFPFVL